MSMLFTGEVWTGTLDMWCVCTLVSTVERPPHTSLSTEEAGTSLAREGGLATTREKVKLCSIIRAGIYWGYV